MVKNPILKQDVIEAKQRAQKIAFTGAHPAVALYLSLRRQLTYAESQQVDAQVPGEPCIGGRCLRS